MMHFGLIFFRDTLYALLDFYIRKFSAWFVLVELVDQQNTRLVNSL